MLYAHIAPSLMTDDQIEYTIKEIDQEIASCAKLKPGPWSTEISTASRSWQDDPSTMCVQVLAPHRGGEGGAYHIAGGTIYATQREVFFMAAMREDYPEALGHWRAALVYIRELRKKATRRKGRAR